VEGFNRHPGDDGLAAVQGDGTSKRTTHLLSGAAVGAAVSVAVPCDPYLLIAVGALFGIAPDFDLLLSPLFRGAHRSAGSHSLLASFVASASWAVVLVFVAPALDPSLAADENTLASTTAVVFLSMFVHAAEDSLSIGGCRLFYPLSKRRFRGPVRYDDIATNSVLMAIAVAVILASSGLLS
jgi:membrane-bound metal-dependent hydrolase YbcI (DUF457 family)